MLKFQRLSRPSTWYKSKTAHFYLQPLFNACIAIDIFDT